MPIVDNMLHRYSDVACCRLWSRLGEWHHRDGVASAIATRWGQFVTLVFISCPETAHAKHSKRCKRWKRVQTMMSYQKPHDDVNTSNLGRHVCKLVTPHKYAPERNTPHPALVAVVRHDVTCDCPYDLRHLSISSARTFC